jgi:putative FmdB family regulatory protein
MPVYEFKCQQCGMSFEKLVFHDAGETQCPRCLGKVERLMSRFNVAIPDEVCEKLPKGESRELCTECRQGGGACPFTA